MFVYVKNSSGKRKVSKRLVIANADHDRYIDSVLAGRKLKPSDRAFNIDAKEYRIPNNVAPLSNSIPAGGGYKRSVDDYKWRRGREERTDTILEIQKKKTRIAPLWNKGANQFITEGSDIKTLGRKI